MKKIHLYILIPILLFFTASGCKKMDKTYKDYVVPGGNKYAGKANTALAYSGNHRVKISWLRGADPSVRSAKIYWNNYADSALINYPVKGDTISHIISNLKEQTYSFIIKTYDNMGNSSVPVELVGASYGANYQAGLLTRFVVSSEVDTNGDLIVIWGNPDITGGAHETEITYTNLQNQTKVQKFTVRKDTSIIHDYKRGTTYKYRTLFMPDSLSIDTFYTPIQEQVVTTKYRKFLKTNWIATADSSEPRDDPSFYVPQKAIDDNITTFWHTPWTVFTPFPHWLRIDMRETFNVAYVELTCRQGNVKGITRFDIQGSMDGTTWTTYKAGNVLVQQNATQRFNLDNVVAMRYLRIYATAGVEAPTHLAEVSAYGY